MRCNSLYSRLVGVQKIKTMKKALIEKFEKNQTLTTLCELRNLGVGLKMLSNNKWETLSEYKLPFNKFIPLYDDNFEITDIGVYLP